MAIDPATTIVFTVKIFGAFTDSMELLSRLVRKRISVFLWGIAGVGKSSCVLALKNKDNYLIETINSSSGYDSSTISNPGYIDGRTFTGDVVIHNYAGGEESQSNRQNKLIETAPMAVLFFIDHRDTVKDEDEHRRELPVNPARGQKSQWIDKNREWLQRIDPDRMEEHRKRLRQLIEILRTSDRVRNSCKVIILVVTKSDLWRTCHRINDFSQYLSQEIKDLHAFPNLIVSDLISFSAIDREGKDEIFRYVIQTDQDIKRLLGRKYRLP